MNRVNKIWSFKGEKKTFVYNICVFASSAQVGAIPANAVDDGQWSQGLISAVSAV